MCERVILALFFSLSSSNRLEIGGWEWWWGFEGGCGQVIATEQDAPPPSLPPAVPRQKMVDGKAKPTQDPYRFHFPFQREKIKPLQKEMDFRYRDDRLVLMTFLVANSEIKNERNLKRKRGSQDEKDRNGEERNKDVKRTFGDNEKGKEKQLLQLRWGSVGC